METADAVRVVPLEPDVVTQLQEQARQAPPSVPEQRSRVLQVALLSSLFFNYTGGLATTVPPARPVPCCNNLSARSRGVQVSVVGEPVLMVGGAPPSYVHDLPLLARNVTAAHKRVRCHATCATHATRSCWGHPRLTRLRLLQVEELADALPPREARTERMARLDALRADVAAAGAELQAELHDAGACRHCRNFTDVCTDCLFAPQRLHCQAFAACVLASQTRRSRNSNGLAC